MESGSEPVQHSIESHWKATRPEQEGQFRNCWLPGEINEGSMVQTEGNTRAQICAIAPYTLPSILLTSPWCSPGGEDEPVHRFLIVCMEVEVRASS